MGHFHVANFQQKALFGQKKKKLHVLSSSVATLALKLWLLLVFVLLKKKKKLPHHQCGFVNHWNTGLQEGHTKAEHECGVWNHEEDPPSPSPSARWGGNKRITHETMVGILFHTVSVVSLWNADTKYIYIYIYISDWSSGVARLSVTQRRSWHHSQIFSPLNKPSASWRYDAAVNYVKRTKKKKKFHIDAI